MIKFFHSFGVIEIIHAPRFAANDAEQAGPYLVLPRLGGMAERAFFEIRLAGFDISGGSGANREKR
jgi:hypothetical protein